MKEEERKKNCKHPTKRLHFTWSYRHHIDYNEILCKRMDFVCKKKKLNAKCTQIDGKNFFECLTIRKKGDTRLSSIEWNGKNKTFLKLLICLCIKNEKNSWWLCLFRFAWNWFWSRNVKVDGFAIKKRFLSDLLHALLE